MKRLILLTAWLLLIASPLLAQPSAPAAAPTLPSQGNSAAAPVPTTPPERIAPPAHLGEAGPAEATPFSAGPSGTVAGSDATNPQSGRNLANPDRPLPGK